MPYNYFMRQSTRLLMEKRQGALYIGDRPDVNPRQCIEIGVELLLEGELSEKQRAEVHRRQETLMKEFLVADAESTTS